MSRFARRLAGFRPVHETFRGVRWKRQNRLWHETHTRRDPRFSAACKLDWSRVLKRPDTRHLDGRQLGIVGRVVHFVVYVKRNGFLHAVRIRYADDDEANLFFRQYP